MFAGADARARHRRSIGGCGTSTLVRRVGQADEMVRWWQGEVSRFVSR